MKADQRQRTACFSGHRDMPGGMMLKEIQRRTEAAVTGLIEQGYRYFGVGGTRGYDAVAAASVLKLKDKHPNIHLIIVLPYADEPAHEGNWSAEELRQHNQLKEKASKVVVLAERYSSGARNRCQRHLVDCSSACVVYLSHANTETSYAVTYAQSKHLKIINTAELLGNISGGL